MKTTYYKPIRTNIVEPIQIDFESIILIDIAKEHNLTMKTLRNLLKFYNGTAI